MPRVRVFYSATCPTCCRGPATPFRIHDNRGRVVSGCVDEFHAGHLVSPSESARWHARPEAKRIRAQSRAARDNSITLFRRS